jgi:hypothetical protein
MGREIGTWNLYIDLSLYADNLQYLQLTDHKRLNLVPKRHVLSIAKRILGPVHNS